ncbi:MAG: DUF3445 domain-containing protein [Chthoniobacter sp.]|nr:DUF3445 domain-containing protein [Chthoniobacter sp.]
MSLRAGDAAAYWGVWDKAGAILAERKRWREASPELFVGCRPEGEAGRVEAVAWMRQWAPEPEADWVVLSADIETEPVAVAGEVIFPSAWSLPEKLGLPLSAVHAPVPALQQTIGASIQTFLARIACEAAWERENWGLSAHTELNFHPVRRLPRLTAEARLETTWVRLERQFLTRLPVTRCLLFGIRVSNHRLDEAAADPEIGRRIARALHTMPEAMADYKGVGAARSALIRLLAPGANI